MKNLIELLLPMSGAAAEAMLNGVWQGMLLTLLVWGALRLFPRLNAASRFAIWWLALLALVCLPLIHGWKRIEHDSAIRAARLAAGGNAAKLSPHVNPRSGAADPFALWWCDDDERLAALGSSARGPFALTWHVTNGRLPLAVMALWVAVAGAMAGRVVWGFLQLRRIKRAGKPLSALWQDCFQSCWATHGPQRPIRLCSSNEVSSPMAVGFLHPVILIPENLGGVLTTEEFKQVCLHELAHLKRRDDWTNLAQHFIRAFYCFHPAVRWIGRQLASEREIACDDLVISATRDVKPYALCLTKLVELTRVTKGCQLAPGASLTRTQLGRRINLLLDRRRNSSHRLSKGSFATAMILLITILALSFEMVPLIALAGSSSSAIELSKGSVKPIAELLAPKQANDTKGDGIPDIRPRLKLDDEVQLASLDTPPVPSTPVPPPPGPPTKPELLDWDASEKSLTATNGQLKAQFFFAVTNISAADVVIDGVHTSCGCTVAKLPATPWVLKPKDSGKIEVTVDLLGKSGLVIKQATIVSTNAQKVLTVRVTVPELPEVVRGRNQTMAKADPQAIFRNDCAKCHVEPAAGKLNKELYVAACGICHEAANRASMVPDLRNLNHPTDYAFWKEIIRNGKPNTMMPSFSNSKGGPLNDAQVESLAELLTKAFPSKPGLATTPAAK